MKDSWGKNIKTIEYSDDEKYLFANLLIWLIDELFITKEE